MQIVSFVTRLEQQLHSIEQQVIEMLNASTIEKRQIYPFSSLAVITNAYYWGKTEEKQQYVQIKLLRKYLSWFEQFHLLFYNSPEMLRAEIIIAHSEVQELIEKKNGMYVPSTINKAKKTFQEHIQTYYRLLGLFKTSDKPIIILVPDTNALIKAPDVSSYRA